MAAANARRKIRQQTGYTTLDDDASYKRIKDLALTTNTQGPFFNKLNFDIRRIIYDYLYGGLPPVSLGTEESSCMGLVLSCKQAHVELSEAASRHLILFIQEFSTRFRLKYDANITLYKPIPVCGGFSALRNITLSLPFSIFNFGNSRTLPPTPISFRAWEDFWKLHLLRRPFDKVTFIVQDGDRPWHDTQTERNAIADAFRAQLEVITWYICDDWHAYQKNLDSALLNKEKYGDGAYPDSKHCDRGPERRHFRTAEQYRIAQVQWKHLFERWGFMKYRASWPSRSARVCVKHICFAWNLLNTKSSTASLDSIKMKGKKFTYTKEYAEKLRKYEEMRRLKYDNVWPHRYEVMSADGLVGEMAIVSPRRWTMARDEYLYFDQSSFYNFVYDEFGDDSGIFKIWKQLLKEEDVQMLGVGGNLSTVRGKENKAG
jgi:hypothetical protein